MNTVKKGVPFGAAIGVYMLYLCVSGNGAATGAMASLAAAFPDVPFTVITMINTVPSITLILGALLMGAIVGKKMSFKTAGILALASYGVLGILPTFINDSFYTILVIRIIYGFSTGMIAPLGAAAFLRMIRDYDTRSKYIGYGNAWQNFGCFLLTVLGGWLCAIDWTYTFLAYLLCIVALIVFLFTFKEPPSVDEIIKAEGITDTSEFAQAKKVKLPPLVWVIVIIFGALVMITSPYMMNFSSIMAEKCGAGAGTAGTLLGIFTLAGVASTALNGVWVRLFRRWSGLIALCVGFAGIVITAMATSVPMFTIGIIVFGFGYLIMLPLISVELGSLTNAAGLAWVELTPKS